MANSKGMCTAKSIMDAEQTLQHRRRRRLQRTERLTSPKSTDYQRKERGGEAPRHSFNEQI